jgi:transposase
MAAVEKARRAGGYVSVGEILRTDPFYRDLHRQRAVLEKKLTKISRKRRGFFDSNFKKLAKRLIERLKQQEVTHLVTSRNIIEKKSIGSELGRVQNQKFYHIPFGQLLDALKLFAEKSGLTLIDSVDEAYTSKTSCLSGDVLRAQNEKIPADLRSDVFQGRRVKRGSYEDAPSGRRIHADINAAVNILRVYYRGERDLERQGLSPVKLSNPRVIKKDALLRLLDQPLADPCLGGEQAPFGAPRFQVGAQSYS